MILGKFLHIDFGFILGRDPKVYPPPVKLCIEMVEGMGGKNSEGYKTFQKKCIECYLYLRKYAKLILNLFHLMLDSGIKVRIFSNIKESLRIFHLQDISQEALAKMTAKFYMEENDENAERHFLETLETSVEALFPVIFDKFHQWKQYWV